MTRPTAFLTVLTAISASAMAAETPGSLRFECDSFRYTIGVDGRNLAFIDTATGEDVLKAEPASPCARVRKAGREYPATKAVREGDLVRIEFGEARVSADVRFSPQGRRLVVEVVGASGEGIEELAFIDVPLQSQHRRDAGATTGTTTGATTGATTNDRRGDRPPRNPAGEPFAACCLALNLQTNVHELPGPNSRLRALCYPRFGLAGARAAIVGSPTSQLREALQEAVSAAPDVPHSPLGGAWGLDAEINQGSYLFNFTDLTEDTVDEWIRTARACGMNQIDFHGGHSFRFGDVRFNPQLYPRGRESMKAVIDKLHAAGIKAGLHTYAFFIDKGSPYVTPTPSPHLGKDATFTLTDDLAAETAVVPVAESTEKMSTVTGFFVPNSVTIQIDDELITYTGLSKEPPYAFTGCQRGAYGTKAAPHEKGAKVHHLKECFGYFLPDGDSPLFTEIAANTAEAFNECGFDMIYLDALDGEGVVAGPEVGWHYGSKFVFELWKRLKRPALMEMSTFHHHLWYVRSRYVAWDHPHRGHKTFIDFHMHANETSRRMFMAGHLGWWRVLTWTGDTQIEPTFADDIEYLCGKCIGTDTGFSLQGVDPNTLKNVPAFARLAGIMRQYEELRHQNYFPEEVKARLRQPGSEFRLVREDDRWTFRPAVYHKHKVTGLDGGSNVWTVNNPFDRQPLKLRIEALWSAGPYNAPGNPVLADFTQAGEFPDRQTAPHLTADLKAVANDHEGLPPLPTDGTKGLVSTTFGRYSVTSAAKPGDPAWTSMTKTFSPPMNLASHQGMGLWIHGDGRGQVLNLQLRSPDHLPAGYAEHYVPIDFTGWRYVELIEAEGDRCADYQWPYSGQYYDLYRENVYYDQVHSLGLWYNNIPAGQTATCYLSPIKALPLVKAKISNPILTVNGQAVIFPVTMETGMYLELGPDFGEAPSAASPCRLYGPDGALLGEVKPDGDLPILRPGGNRIELNCGVEGSVTPRLRVTIITQGKPLD